MDDGCCIAKKPHAPPLRGSLPPGGAFFALGRPGGKKHAPRRARAFAMEPWQVQNICWPPLMEMLAPVTKAASSDAR
ncbi:hypothetical protein E6C76_00040 [Pseudothauera nasutitermitis]|uniref:Uncharacterized protein n=1 Tax=Pseudothauera nasutitermitis TaxID=2565930 RepID=A0A4S4B2H0_9RHOO|nr:hypothetical protein E6C76_00040 [Pseudothauera nasutitermitis]